MENPGLLIWDDAQGIGFFPANTKGEYGKDYWERYQEMAKTPIGKALNEARVNLVNKYVGNEHVLDIGIGDGTFIRQRSVFGGGLTYGHDVNQYALDWLTKQGLHADPVVSGVKHFTFWDSLEHIVDAAQMVDNIKGYCFVSIPIFKNRAHIESSKHFRKTEHFWYFSAAGLVSWFASLGFHLCAYNDMETQLGREDIGTFVFKRND